MFPFQLLICKFPVQDFIPGSLTDILIPKRHPGEYLLTLCFFRYVLGGSSHTEPQFRCLGCLGIVYKKVFPIFNLHCSFPRCCGNLIFFCLKCSYSAGVSRPFLGFTETMVFSNPFFQLPKLEVHPGKLTNVP